MTAERNLLSGTQAVIPRWAIQASHPRWRAQKRAVAGEMTARPSDGAPAAELSANHPPESQRWIALTRSDSSTIGFVM